MNRIALKNPLVILVSLVILLSCNSKPGQEQKSIPSVVTTTADTLVIHDWDAIKAKGKLKAILKNSPTGYYLYKGKPMGFEYELLSRFCLKHNLQLEVILESDVEKCFKRLGEGSCDIIAHNLTITKERMRNAEFTDPQYSVRQMLVQRLPDNYQKLKQHELERTMIRDPIELIGKEVHVRKNSSYVQRLKNLSGEMGGDVKIIEEFGDIQTEELMDMVARKEIDYTMADEDIAKITATYYHNLDINTPLSFPTQIAWAVNKNSPGLLKNLNEWLRTIKSMPDYNVIYNRYFNDPKSYLVRVKSDYSSVHGKKVSPYDALIKKYAKKINWDWRLLAALIYRESHFDPKAESWAGAQGLMQMMPETAKLYKVKNVMIPEESIKAGTEHITAINNFLKGQVKDENERLKFILASYNVGLGHVEDAIKLTAKYQKNPAKWDDNVEYYLLKKSEPVYYEDKVATSGYCRGAEPVNYVREILKQYNIYRQLLKK